MVQWLRLYTLNAGGLGSILGHGTRSHMLHQDLRQPNKFLKKQSVMDSSVGLIQILTRISHLLAL